MPALLLIDKNDPQKEDYFKIELPPQWTLVLTESRPMGEKIQECWERIKDLDYVLCLNDDHRCRTPNWDQKVIAHVRPGNLIGTNDGWMAPKRICGVTCWSGSLLRAVGYVYPPGLKHLFIDSVWETLAQKTGCAQILMDVLVEHEHAYRDQKKQDETFFEVNGAGGLVNGHGIGGFWPHDKKVFEEWLKNDSDKDAQKILALQPKQGLMIGSPSHDGNCNLDYALGLTDLSIFLSQNQIYFEMARVVGSSLLPHARNSLVDMFLRSRCQKLLFMDVDQGWTKEAVMHLFQSDKKIVAGVVPHKRFPINLNFEPLERDHKYFKDLTNKSGEEFFSWVREKADSKGEIEVNRSGAGFMMVDRSVFEKMKDHVEEYQAFDNNLEIMHREYFWMGAKQGKYYGEDWTWCVKAKELGFPIHINANATATHRGQFSFQIDRPVA